MAVITANKFPNAWILNHRAFGGATSLSKRNKTPITRIFPTKVYIGDAQSMVMMVLVTVKRYATRQRMSVNKS